MQIILEFVFAVIDACRSVADAVTWRRPAQWARLHAGRSAKPHPTRQLNNTLFIAKTKAANENKNFTYCLRRSCVWSWGIFQGIISYNYRLKIILYQETVFKNLIYEIINNNLNLNSFSKWNVVLLSKILIMKTPS